MEMTYDMRCEQSSDNATIESIIAEAFGAARKERWINHMRAGCLPYQAGCLVAEENDGHLLGSIRYYMAQVDSGEAFPFLGPLAVKPNLRGKGIGKSLIAKSLQGLKSLGHAGVLIIGDSGYYAPFGFNLDAVAGLQLGGSVAPLTFMGLEWQAGAVASASGVVKFIENPNS